MKYGFTIPGSGPLTEPDNLSAVAKRGEELGYDLVVAPDHLVLPRAIDSVYPYAEDGIHQTEYTRARGPVRVWSS